MLICRNAEGVHGQRKVGNLWLRALMRFSVHSTLSRNFFHPTNKLTCLLSWEAIRGLHARGGRSHFFRLRLRSCSKIFESGSGNISNFSIWLLFTLRLPSIQPKSTHVFSLEMTAQTFFRNDRTNSCCCRNRKVTPDPVSSEISDPVLLVGYFAFQSKGRKFDNCFFWCALCKLKLSD